MRSHLSKWIAAAFLASSIPATAAEYRVFSADDIRQREDELRPGDMLVMADGVWKDQKIIFRGSGTEAAPITLQAETLGGVVLEGKSSVTIDGSHLVVRGIVLRGCRVEADAFRMRGSSCRLTECAVIGGAHKFFVHLFGERHRVDQSFLADKTSDSPTLQIEVEAGPNHHRIDHNHFGPRPPLGRNGGETIRIGYSHQSMRNSRSLVEHNLFEACDGEIEIISSKSCENVFRFNTFRRCAGMLTLRHGDRCVVEGNFFLGEHTRGSGGIRVIGQGHRLINNYIAGVEKGGFWITSGIVDSPLKGYVQARDCLIAFNTVVDSAGPCVDLDAGHGSANRTLRPAAITLANNLFVPGASGTIFTGTEGEDFVWEGNVVCATSQRRSTRARVFEFEMIETADGLWRPQVDSPIQNAAKGNYPEGKSDIDGQSRGAEPDVGCDEVSEEPVANRPLTSKDVGPTWRRNRP